MDRLFLTEREVQKRYNIGLQTLRNDRCLGRGLPYYKFGRKVLYRDDEVYQAINSRRINVDE